MVSRKPGRPGLRQQRKSPHLARASFAGPKGARPYQRRAIEIEREDDGRWIAEIPDLPGVMVYGTTREEAVSKVETLALRAIADRLERGEEIGPRMLARIAARTGLTPNDF